MFLLLANASRPSCASSAFMSPMTRKSLSMPSARPAATHCSSAFEAACRIEVPLSFSFRIGGLRVNDGAAEVERPSGALCDPDIAEQRVRGNTFAVAFFPFFTTETVPAKRPFGAFTTRTRVVSVRNTQALCWPVPSTARKPYCSVPRAFSASTSSATASASVSCNAQKSQRKASMYSATFSTRPFRAWPCRCWMFQDTMSAKAGLPTSEGTTMNGLRGGPGRRMRRVEADVAEQSARGQ